MYDKAWISWIIIIFILKKNLSKYFSSQLIFLYCISINIAKQL